MLLTLALCLVQDTAPFFTPEHVMLRLPQSSVEIAIELPGFQADAAGLAFLRRSLGDAAMLAGSFSGELQVSVICRRLEAPTTSRAFLESLFGAPAPEEQVEVFEERGAACRRSLLVVEDLTKVDFNGCLVLAGTLALDVHVSELAEATSPTFGRDDFARLMRSLRAGFARRGHWSELPRATLEAFDDALRTSDPLAAIEPRFLAAPDDLALLFAKTELAALAKRDAPRIESAKRALELLDRRREPLPAAEVLLCVLLCDSLGVAYQNQERWDDSLAPLERGWKLTESSKDPLHAAFAYNLACTWAQKHDAAKSARYLKEAIAGEARYKESARKDADFDPVRAAGEVAELLR